MPGESSPINAVPNTYGSAPQEWKDFYVSFEDTKKRVVTKILSLDRAKQSELFAKMHQKQKESFLSVDNPGRYLAYHKSLGGSTGPIDAPNLDFEGEHSLLKFYEDLDKELGQEVPITR